MEPPSPYDWFNGLLGFGALVLSYLRFRDGRRRPAPYHSATYQKIEGQPAWVQFNLSIKNPSDVLLFVERIQVPWWSRTRLLSIVDGQTGNSWSPEYLQPLPVGLASRSLPIASEVEPGGQRHIPFLIYRKRRCIFAILRHADSRSTSKLKAHIP